MLRRSQFAFVGMLFIPLLAVVENRSIADDQSAPADKNRPQTIRVALIDVAKVFKSCNTYTEDRNELKKLITAKEADAKILWEEIKSLTEDLDDFEKGSTEYKALEDQLERQQADFEAFRKTSQREVLNLESKIYRQTYERMEAAVQTYAEEHDLDLVIRLHSQQKKKEEVDPKTLMDSKYSQVVFHTGLGHSHAGYY